MDCRWTKASPNDAAPEKRENDVEKQRAPDDKVVDPGPVTCVQGKLDRREKKQCKHQTTQWTESFTLVPS